MKNEKYSVVHYDTLILTGNLESDLNLIKQIFKKDDVLRIRKAQISPDGQKCALLFMDGMSSSGAVASDILRSVFTAKIPAGQTVSPEYMSEKILYSGEVKITKSVTEMLRSIMYGDTLMIIDGFSSALNINTKGFRTRGISEPPDERVASGPREGFCEAAMFNVAQIRRKLLTPDFCAEVLRIGRRTDTVAFICYLGSLADKRLVSELKKRISEIDIDGVLDTNYIAEIIRDNKHGIFKTTGSTERPDVVAARLLEGRVALVVDGTPVVMTVPYLFSENFQSDDDYYSNWLVGSVARVLRIAAFILSVFLPATFLAVICYNIELLPTAFALSVMRLRTGVPLSSVAECVILILAFELLKEAGARAPQYSGQALSIVGGLVMGQTAVEAKIVSAPMLIAVAVAGVCAAVVPKLRAAVFYLRLICVFMASVLGLIGVFITAAVTMLYILSINSFGSDYTSAVFNPDFSKLKDTFLRAEWRKMIKRPVISRERKRQKSEK